MSNTPTWLTSLLETPGVNGVFLLSPQGVLLLNRLSPLFHDSLFDQFGDRLVDLIENINTNYMPSNELVLHFSEQALSLRKSENCILGLLIDRDVNPSGIRLVTNVAIKQLTPDHLASLNAPPQPSSVPEITVPKKRLYPQLFAVLLFFIVLVGVFFLVFPSADSQPDNLDRVPNSNLNDAFVEIPGIPITEVTVSGGDHFSAPLDEVPTNFRLFGIDAPEPGQELENEAMTFLQSTIKEKILHVEIIDQDRSGNRIVNLYAGGNPVSLNEQLVRQGLAWHFYRFAPEADHLAAAQEAARSEGVGVWSLEDPVEPWVYRRENP